MNEAALRKFCAVNDIRAYLHNPIRRDGNLYATNGHIAVCVPDNPTIAADSETPIPDFSFLHKAINGISEFTPLSVDLPEPAECPVCDGRQKVMKCPDCDGEGEFEHGKNTYDCKECNGDGWVYPGPNDTANMECPHCKGLGKDPYQTVRINGTPFAVRYVSMLKELPGVAIWTNKTDLYGTGYFKFDGGFGALMPCREK